MRNSSRAWSGRRAVESLRTVTRTRDGSLGPGTEANMVRAIMNVTVAQLGIATVTPGLPLPEIATLTGTPQHQAAAGAAS